VYYVHRRETKLLRRKDRNTARKRTWIWKLDVLSEKTSLPVVLQLVFKGPVAWTEKMTATEPNPTDCNRTVGCGCLVWGLVGLPVALIQKYLKTV
jgi:hypothetical protein